MSIYKATKNIVKDSVIDTALRGVNNPIAPSFYSAYKMGSSISKPSSPTLQMAERMNTTAKNQAPFGGFLSYYNTPLSGKNTTVNTGASPNTQNKITSYYSNPSPIVNKPLGGNGQTEQKDNFRNLTEDTNQNQGQTESSSPQTTYPNTTSEFDFETMKKNLGLKDAPGYTAPDLSRYDSEYEKMREDQKLSNADIERNLNSELDSISKRYEIERKKASDQTENERQSQLSNLYSLGMVNPASSGVSSIGTASQKVLDERNANIAAAESSEKSAAQARAYGQKTAGFDKALQMLTSQRDEINKRATDKYGMDRQVWQDAASEIGTIMNIWKAGKQLGQDDKDNMQKNISTLLTSFGSGAFANVDPKELAKVEQIAGFPKGSLVGGIKTLKEKELEAKKAGGAGLNLKEIDGNLYNIRTDQDGNLVPELVIQSTGGGSKELNQLLSPSEAQTLGVPYGTTRGQAAQMGISIGGGGGGRPLTDTQAKLISEGSQLSLVLDPIKDLITNKSDLFGPWAGRTAGNNPYNTDATSAKAQLKTAAQIVGGYLEGGKLTDADVPKYEAMLPSLTDTPAVAKNKLDQIAGLIKQKQEQYLQDFSRAGYNTSGFNGGNQNNSQNSEINRYTSQLRSGEILVQDKQGRIGAIPEKDFDPGTYTRVGQGFKSPLSMGLKDSFVEKYPEGARGGQCASFARKLAYIPPLGDYLSDKKTHVDEIGIPASQWRKNPQVGDVIISNDNKINGHVYLINTLLPNRMARVTESNYHNNQRVTHDRIVSLDSNKIYGAIRAPLKV